MRTTHRQNLIADLGNSFEVMQTMTLAPDSSATPRQPIVLRYARTDVTHLNLEGNLGAQSYTIGLALLDTKRTRLMSRGFHWINR